MSDRHEPGTLIGIVRNPHQDSLLLLRSYESPKPCVLSPHGYNNDIRLWRESFMLKIGFSKLDKYFWFELRV